jgi:hypothetical protein
VLRCCGLCPGVEVLKIRSRLGEPEHLAPEARNTSTPPEGPPEHPAA